VQGSVHQVTLNNGTNQCTIRLLPGQIKLILVRKSKEAMDEKVLHPLLDQLQSGKFLHSHFESSLIASGRLSQH
jgi:hypothetical protein